MWIGYGRKKDAKKWAVLFTAGLLLLAAAQSFAQVTPCSTAIKATPPGPFPCSIALSWTDNDKAGTPGQETEFQIQRGLNGAAFADWGKQAADQTTWIDATLTQSMTTANSYAYRVRSVNSAGNSGWSNEATYVIPQGIPPVVPPTGPGNTLTITFYNPDGTVNQVIQLSGDLKGYLK